MAEPRRSEQDHTDANEADEVDPCLEEVKHRRYAVSQGPSLTTMPPPLKGPSANRSFDGAGEIPSIPSPDDDEVIMKSTDPMRSTAVATCLLPQPRVKQPSSVVGSPPTRKQQQQQPSSLFGCCPTMKQQQQLFKLPFGPYFSESGVQELPALFHLESTNFVVKAVNNIVLSFTDLARALRDTFKQTKIDIIDFVDKHAVFDCSYHQGNRFMGLFVRVFKPPSMSSGQLLDDEGTVKSQIADSLLVEVQLREGDRLYFSSLFREIQDNLQTQGSLILTGYLRYEPKIYPAKGEGLRLESLPDHQRPSFGMGGMYQGVTEIEGSDSYESMDDDMIEDVIKLAEAHQSKYIDVQADAATAVAGLTCDAEFLSQLADQKAIKASEALCSAAARLLAETNYRPARRQAAVAVANLSTIPVLCSFLLASDPKPKREIVPIQERGIVPIQERGIVDTLVTLSMLASREGKEEEIGTRRECMRALIEMAKIESTKNTPPMVNLRKSKPSGKGCLDEILMKRHSDCKSILSGKISNQIRHET